MNTRFRTATAFLLLSAFLFSLGGCHTMSGLGKDTQQAGQAIEDEAEEHIDEND